MTFSPMSVTSPIHNIPHYSPSQPPTSTASSYYPSIAQSPITQSQKRPHNVTDSEPESSTSSSSDSEDVIGHVLANKKFKCSVSRCSSLTFNRQADLRRHYDNRHASTKRDEYFCTVSGCPRGYSFNGERGKSFGQRKDKRDEHVRTVHRDEPLRQRQRRV